MKLTKPLLLAAVAGMTAARADLWLAPLNDALATYKITTQLQVSHFLAQVGHESIGFSASRESLNYSVEALLSTFGRHRISEADARQFGRTATRAANQSAIANLVYGGEWGRKNLGNTQPGDGWKFRGTGPMQTTGRANFAAVSKALGVDFLAFPERLAEPRYGALAAGYFWSSRNLNALAVPANQATLNAQAALANQAALLAITRTVNGGTNGLADRQARFVRAGEALGLPAAQLIV